MVQLPATAAIEYVAACCRTRTRTKIKTVRGAYSRSPQVQCIYAPSRLSVPIIVAWRTKKTKRQTRPPSSAGSRPPLPKFSGYVEVEAHYIFHPSTIWVWPLFTEVGPKSPPPKKNADFAMKQTNICRLSGDIKKQIYHWRIWEEHRKNAHRWLLYEVNVNETRNASTDKPNIESAHR